jgi:hypothetical protein
VYGVRSITDSDRTPMSTISNAVGAMDHGHDGGIAKAWWNLRQFRGAELAGYKFANIFIDFRMLREVAPVGFDSFSNVIEGWCRRPRNGFELGSMLGFVGVLKRTPTTLRECHFYSCHFSRVGGN